MDDLITPKQLAGKLQISVYTLTRWTKQGDIPFYRLNGKDIRYSPNEVDAWLRERSGLRATNSGPRPFQGKRKQQED